MKIADVPQEQQRDLFHTMAPILLRDVVQTLTENVLEITPQEVRQQIAVMEECHRQNPFPSSKRI